MFYRDNTKQTVHQNLTNLINIFFLILVLNLRQTSMDENKKVIVVWDPPEIFKCITGYQVYKDGDKIGPENDISNLQAEILGLTDPCQKSEVTVVPLMGALEMELNSIDVFNAIDGKVDFWKITIHFPYSIHKKEKYRI